MDKEFAILKTTRENIHNVVSSLSQDQLVSIPTNFKNNILWNYGHVIVTQQLLCYRLAKVDITLSDDLVNRYKKGTMASGDFNEDDIKIFNKQCFENVIKVESDYKKGLFNAFEKYPTSYGIELNSIEDAIKFNNVHEALHLGYMMALRKSL